MASPTRTKLSRAVATMIALDFQPMSIVEDAGFRQLVKALDPKCVLPTCHTLTKEILPQLLSEKVESLKTKLRQTKDVSLMTDAWTSTNNTPYLVITAHFFCENSSDKNISLASSILTCSKIKESCTGEYLKEELISACDKFLIQEKLVACVTDGGQNMIKAVKEMKGGHHISCFNHLLNLCVQHATDNTPGFKSLKEKVNSFVTKTRQSTTAKRAFEEC